MLLLANIWETPLGRIWGVGQFISLALFGQNCLQKTVENRTGARETISSFVKLLVRVVHLCLHAADYLTGPGVQVLRVDLDQLCLGAEVLLPCELLLLLCLVRFLVLLLLLFLGLLFSGRLLLFLACLLVPLFRVALCRKALKATRSGATLQPFKTIIFQAEMM